MSKKALQSTFEFTGNTSSDGTHSYNQYVQRDNKGRELSISQANAMYCRNLTTKEEVVLGDLSSLAFRADYESGDYLFETKLKDGRVFQGTLTHKKEESESKPEEHVALGEEQNSVEEVETPEPSTDQSAEQPEQDEKTEEAPQSNDEADTNASDNDEDSEGSDEPTEESSEEQPTLDEQYAQPLTTEEGEVQAYRVEAGGESILPVGDTAEVFETAFEQLLNNEEVQVVRSDVVIATLTRQEASGQYLVSGTRHDDLRDDEVAAFEAITRRILTGQVRKAR